MIKNTMFRVFLMILIAGFVSVALASSASAAGLPCPEGSELEVVERLGAPIMVDITVTPNADVGTVDVNTWYDINGVVFCHGPNEVEDSIRFGQFIEVALQTDFYAWRAEDFYNNEFQAWSLAALTTVECDPDFYFGEYFVQRVISFEEQLDPATNTRVAVSFKALFIHADLQCVGTSQ